MMNLNNHPFAVDAHLELSLVLTFSLPVEDIAAIIPAPLVADLFDDKYTFVAVAMVQSRNLRPSFFPKFMGTDFFLIGYRVFVRYRNKDGRNLRGLFILRSETDSYKMKLLGGLLTKYKYFTNDIKLVDNESSISVITTKTGFKVIASEREETINLPVGSPFRDWKEARRFAGPLPFTFSSDPVSRQLLIVEGQRENWIPRPVEISDYHIPFLEAPLFRNKKLANAFIIRQIPYHWKKGRLESW